MNYRTMVSCDDVFERLTQGPFPGDGHDRQEVQYDAAVQRHLEACHECRALAEGLRPAVNLLHESIAAQDSESLPSYRSLGESAVHEAGDSWSNSERPISSSKQPWLEPGRHRSSTKRRKLDSLFGFAQGLSLLFLCVVFAAVLSSLFQNAARDGGSSSPSLAMAVPIAESIPSPEGIAQLAELGVKDVCFSNTRRAGSTADGGDEHSDFATDAMVLTDAPTPSTESEPHWKCCTECHHANASEHDTSSASPSRMIQACAVCHIGP